MKKKVLIIQYIVIVLMLAVTVEFVCLSNFRYTKTAPRPASQKIQLSRAHSPFTVERAALATTPKISLPAAM